MASGTRDIYLLVPEELAERLLAPLERHFRDDGSVHVVADRRGAERRAGVDDRVLRQPVRTGFDERRAQTVPRDLPPLPAEAQPFAAHLRVIQRLTPVRSGMEYVPEHEVIARAQAGDPEAPTELYWRTYERVRRRLAAGLSETDADGAVKGAYGRIFDRIGEYDGAAEPFAAWLDHVVDDFAREVREDAP